MSVVFKIPPGDPYFCVVGSPIGHSRSPSIHQHFAKQFDIALRYEKVEVPAGQFAAALGEFVAAGGRGMNITVPLKQEAFRAVDHCGDAARDAGAVNTIKVGNDGSTRGDNTDGVGLVTDLCRNHGATISGKQVLLLGAGGAARGVVPNLCAEAPKRVVIANRTVANAEELAAAFADHGEIVGCGFADVPHDVYDVIINATSLGLAGDEVPPIADTLIDSRCYAYDMMYTPSGDTPFLNWCRQHGARFATDGLGMLIEQAAAAFSIWYDVTPETAPVIAAMRDSQASQ